MHKPHKYTSQKYTVEIKVIAFRMMYHGLQTQSRDTDTVEI